MKTPTPLLLLLGLAPVVACGSSGKQGAAPYVPPPASAKVDDPGAVAIRREAFVIDGVVPPANPQTGQATPAEQNRVRVVRYRVDADPPKPARAIVVMMPGFQGGAGSLDGIARAIVRRSAEGDALEAWAIDRRSNLLEDTWGLDVAEVKKDPQQAREYYFDAATVEGKTFDGFLSGAAAPWASEWGLATTLGDLHNVIALVPDADRAARVILLGHSLGGALVEEYAAWDFGSPGSAEIAGLVMADGVAGDEGKPPSSVDRSTYENGGAANPGGFGKSLGVNSDIRTGNTFFALPLLGVKAPLVAEISAMASRFQPNDVIDDPARDSVAAVLLQVSNVPKATNRGAFGLAFDSASMPIKIDAVACGAATGGALTPYHSLLGADVVHPTDANATYDWLDYDQVTPRENTSLADFARAWFEGPQLNFGEWYFPQRLSLDAQAALTLNVADDDWRSTTYGLKAKYGAQIDVPILAAGFAIVTDVKTLDPLKAMVAPIRAGHPSAGKARTDPDAFTVTLYPTLTHLDGIVGADIPGTPVGNWYEQVVAFVRKQTPVGGVVVPVHP